MKNKKRPIHVCDGCGCSLPITITSLICDACLASPLFTDIRYSENIMDDVKRYLHYRPVVKETWFVIPSRLNYDPSV